MRDIIRVYIGFDKRESVAWEICAESILANTSYPVQIVKLDQERLRMASMYRRQFYKEGEQMIDAVDGLPFSTDFSFSRFLVPALCLWQGHAIFVDSDFLFRDDIARLWGMRSNSKPLQVVKNVYHPKKGRKMRDGVRQTDYPRKLWSSLMLWNCAHPKTQALTPYQVNFYPGPWLQQFKWLEDSDIGEIPSRWNWVNGASDAVEPAAIHFTEGTPDVPGMHDTPYADEWFALRDSLN